MVTGRERGKISKELPDVALFYKLAAMNKNHCSKVVTPCHVTVENKDSLPSDICVYLAGVLFCTPKTCANAVLSSAYPTC